MPRSDLIDIDTSSPPFDRLKGISVLATNRSGRESSVHARHQLFAARETATAAQVLVKVSSRPGLVYERNLTNEIESLTAINRRLPTSTAFPFLVDHGRMRDGRLYLMTYLFDELPLAASISTERITRHTVSHLRTAIEMARVLMELHQLPIYHVDLNPMNILHRVEQDKPIVRIVDFESSYDPARHASGVFYDPPTTPGYSAPEVSQQPPDARADVCSLGAVLYTMLTGFGWTWQDEVDVCVKADRTLDPELRAILSKAVARKPDRRYASAEALQSALSRYLEGIWPGHSV